MVELIPDAKLLKTVKFQLQTISRFMLVFLKARRRLGLLCWLGQPKGFRFSMLNLG